MAEGRCGAGRKCFVKQPRATHACLSAPQSLWWGLGTVVYLQADAPGGSAVGVWVCGVWRGEWVGRKEGREGGW